MNDDIAIRVDRVSKTFKLPHDKQSSLKGGLINLIKGGKHTYEKQQVLEDVSFEIKKGEFFGIVGRNGSGKSTLLKLLAGIYTPTRGNINVNGKLTPFIELGVGFNPELTGRENVFLNGALLGFNRTEMEAMYDDIVKFAELERFMDQKLKNYSSGMQVRLAFSIAIRANTEILLLDEVLAVGDAAFQQKCYAYFDRLKELKKTMILVSHDMSAIKQFCDEAILISNGKLLQKGNPTKIAEAYEKLNFSQDNPLENTDEDVTVGTYTVSGKNTSNFKYKEDIVLKAEWSSKYVVSAVGFVVYKDKEVVFATNSFHFKELGSRSATMLLKAQFGNGRYTVKVGLFGKGRHDFLGMYGNKNLQIFSQTDKGLHGEEWEGILYLDSEWNTEAGSRKDQA